MKRIFFALMLVVSCGKLLVAQSAPGVATASVPRTTDHRPDLQGIWTTGTLTPFERPVTLGEKAFYSAEELAQIEAQAEARRANPAPPRPGDVGTDNEAFVDSGYRYLPTRQTSLVVEPADGRIAFRKEAEAIRDRNLESRDTYETMSPWDRCITRSPTLMLPGGYNNGTRIVQTPTYVVIESEQIHEARVIPLDGRPHLNPNVRSWTGDPRGHWEGDTLVIDSTNFIPGEWISTHQGSGRLRGTPAGPNLRIVERLTRLDQNTLQYEILVDDPFAFERPWRLSMPMMRDDDYALYEYACHEGNYAIDLVLRGARDEERRAK